MILLDRRALHRAALARQLLPERSTPASTTREVRFVDGGWQALLRAAA